MATEKVEETDVEESFKVIKKIALRKIESSEETDPIIQRNVTEELGLQPGYVVKESSTKLNGRSGIPPEGEILREASTFELQAMLGADFGIPPTTLVNINGNWHSFQEFMPNALSLFSMKKSDLRQIPIEEFYKFVIDILIRNTDRHLGNVLCVNGILHLVDNALTFSDTSIDVQSDLHSDAQYQIELDWISFPQTDHPIDPASPIAQAITGSHSLVMKDAAITAEKFVSRIEEMRQEIEYSGQLPSTTHLPLHVAMILLQEGIVGGYTLREIAAVMQPINVSQILAENWTEPPPFPVAQNIREGDEESQHLFLLAFRNVVEAQGGMSDLAKKTHVGRESLYKILSENGNPKWQTLVSLVIAMGLNLRVS